MIKNLFIALAFALMLINPSISTAAESPVDVQEIFTSSENIDGDDFKYPKGKAEMRLIRVEVENEQLYQCTLILYLYLDILKVVN